MPRRPPLAARPSRGHLLLAALLGTTACTSGGGDGRAGTPAPSPTPRATAPVDVPVPTITASPAAQSCTALLASLPAEIGEGLRRRQVTGDPTRTAAWGEPPVTLECGVAPPARDEPPVELGPDDEGALVGFTVRDVGAANRFTTSRTSVRVAVTVPDTYDSQVLQSLTPALRALQPPPSPTPTPSP